MSCPSGFSLPSARPVRLSLATVACSGFLARGDIGIEELVVMGRKGYPSRGGN